jgi:hypothetical protein
MTANNLTICIDAPCNKKCPYCISNMTFYPEPDNVLFGRNMGKAINMAQMASVSSVLISSKGEPLRNMNAITFCCTAFIDFPVEIQTNGLLLTPQRIKDLRDLKVNTIAISIEKYGDLFNFKHYKLCNDLGIIVRATIVLSDLWTPPSGYDFLADCNQLGIKQVTFRTLSIPLNEVTTAKSMETIDWIEKHQIRQDNLAMFLEPLRSYEKEQNLVRKLSFGPSVYSMEGVAVTTMPYCIQESNNTEDIRSLIYHQDGHMYTSWDKRASILF